MSPATLAETDGTGKLLKSYNPGLSVKDKQGTKLYYLFNGHGDVAGLMDANQDLVQNYTCDAFGAALGVQSDTNHQRYVGSGGVYSDDDAGLQYMWNRWYNPARIRTLMALVEDAQKAGDESRTVGLLDEMIRLNAELSDAEYHLSLIYDKLGYPEKAKALLEASVQLNPQKVDAQLRYGKWMAKMGNRLNAEEAFRSVLAVDPVNKEAQVELWKLLNQP